MALFGLGAVALTRNLTLAKLVLKGKIPSQGKSTNLTKSPLLRQEVITALLCQIILFLVGAQEALGSLAQEKIITQSRLYELNLTKAYLR